MRSYEEGSLSPSAVRQGLMWGLDRSGLLLGRIPCVYPCGCSRYKVALGRCDDYRPGESVKQPLRALVPSAGADVFAEQMRPLLPSGSRIVSTTRRGEDRGHTGRWSDLSFQQTFEQYAEGTGEHDSDALFDLVVAGDSRLLWHAFVDLAQRVLVPDGCILLHGSSDLGTSAEGADLFQKFLPVAQARRTGTIDWGSSWWLWKTGSMQRLPAEWVCQNLPME